MKKHILTIIITVITFTSTLFPQSTVNATGKSQTIDSNTFEYSVGEMAMVNTIQTENISITHGVLQPKDGTLSVEDNPLNFGLTVYPNPAIDMLHIQPALSGGGILRYMMTDINGKAILQKDTTLHIGTEKQQLDINTFADGIYLLHATFTQKGKVHAKTFKIIKNSK